MKMVRGEIVLVDFPFSGGGRSKVRPALVVQNDRDNRRLKNTIIAMITSRTERASEPTQLLITASSPEGRQAGLLMDSVVNFANLFTIEQRKILRTLGRLTAQFAEKADACLKASLSLS
jgi:mRNA interferase MazF